jgi:hypothetical protein
MARALPIESPDPFETPDASGVRPLALARQRDEVTVVQVDNEAFAPRGNCARIWRW